MRVEKSFEVNRSRDEVVELLCRDEVLLQLLPGKSEIIDSSGDNRRLRTHYRALGRDGVATFDFSFLLDGNIRFQNGSPVPLHIQGPDYHSIRVARVDALLARLSYALVHHIV